MRSTTFCILFWLIALPFLAVGQSHHDILRAKYLELSNDSTKLKKSLKYAFKVKKAAENEFGVQSIQYLRSLNNIGYVYNNLNRPKKARHWWLKGATEFEDVESAEINKSKQFLLGNLQVLYTYWIYNQDSAAIFTTKYLNLLAKNEGDSTISYLKEVCIVASDFEDNFNLEGADAYYQRAIAVRKKIFGNFSGQLIQGLDSLYRLDTSEFTLNTSTWRYNTYSTLDTNLSLEALSDISIAYRDSGSAYNNWGGYWHLALMDQALKQKGDTSQFFIKAVERLAWSYYYYSEATIGHYCLQSIYKESKNNKDVKARYLVDVLSDKTALFAKVGYSYENLSFTSIPNHNLFGFPKDSVYANGQAMLDLAKLDEVENADLYIDCLVELAGIIGKSKNNISQEFYQKGNDLMAEALQLSTINHGPESEFYGRVLQKKASLLLWHGELDSAISVALKAYSILEASNTKEENYRLYNLIAAVYGYRHEGAKYNRWLEKAESVASEKAKKDPANRFTKLWEIMQEDVSFGRMNKAQDILAEMELLVEQISIEKRLYKLQLARAKADFYLQNKDFAMADSINLGLLKADLRLEQYASSLVDNSSLAGYLRQSKLQQGKIYLADSFAQLALHFLKRADITRGGNLCEALHDLALVKFKLAQYDSAVFYNTKALSVATIGVDYSSESFQRIRLDLGLALWKTQKMEEAEAIMADACSVLIKRITEQLSGLGEDEKQSVAQRLQDALFKYYSVQNSMIHKAPSSNLTAFNFNIQSKGLLLNTTDFLSKYVKQSGDSTLMAFNDEIKRAKLLLGKKSNTFSANSQSYFNSDSINQLIRRLEQQVSFLSPGISQFEQQNKLTFQDVKKSLTKNEAAIQFVAYPVFDGLSFTGAMNYSAFIVRSNVDNPVRVELSLNHETIQQTERQIANRGATDVSIESVNVSSGLYESIWKPLEEYLSGINKIFLATDGLLNKVSFAGLQAMDSTYLLDKYELHYVINTKDIVLQSEVELNARKGEIALFGGSLFENADALIEQSTTEGSRSLSDDFIGSTGWKYLPNTLLEVNYIDSVMRAAHWTCTTNEGIKASEENFKTLDANSPEIVHVATHGFYFSPTVSNSAQEKKESQLSAMERTGLAFSNANRAWLGGTVAFGAEDGVLTANELSNLDFSSTQLMVLSACETGLGDMLNGEGVFGLQRSIRKAGVKNMLLSLWEVPDKETSEMMQNFYKNIADGESYFTSFLKAQTMMRKKYPEQPALWAAFILIE